MPNAISSGVIKNESRLENESFPTYSVFEKQGDSDGFVFGRLAKIIS